ncbi:hypothetical protein SAMN05443428_11080 [Caloramator quimbayensis]|uniref:Uncharacterized protein n=1 Tax=Caloramator quimbayensis TaxID=1147123 RepID=A0A1T4XMZ3_9CLOT|nr:hypothetical protein [Caloramator quimbayensis]SKA90481.1 hypothetical protein SAMN05443428_11080 [Caloramator quimbayensis]
MDVSMEEVIKNIIHIDKNAAELKRNFDKEIEDRKKKVKEEIESLKCEIVDKELERIKRQQENEIEETLKNTKVMKEAAYKDCEEMKIKFQLQKDKLIQDIFNHIFNQSA